MPPRLTALMQASSTLGEPFSKLITAFALSRNDLSGSNPTTSMQTSAQRPLADALSSTKTTG
jgi:hypothetical protein